MYAKFNIKERRMLKIRHATLSDAKSIAIINVTTWKNAYKGLLPDNFLANRNLSEKRIEYIENQIKNKDDICLVAELDNKIIGYCIGGIPRQYADIFCYELRAFYVLPDYQRSGVGKALFNKFKEITANKPFYLYTLKNNSKAIDFYIKNGGKIMPEYTQKLPHPDLEADEILLAYNLK